MDLPRKLTAIGTVGELGKLFTVYEKNWICPDCTQENYATRPRCFRCRKSKPETEKNYVADSALLALQSGEDHGWKEAIDPNTYQLYYYNEKSGETKWERPEEMGAAPMATGWFGRGSGISSGVGSASYFVEMNTLFLSRPARRQQEYIDPKKYHLEGNNEYNIWYGRYLSDGFESGLNKDPAPFRCDPDKDGGRTRADGLDTGAGSGAGGGGKSESLGEGKRKKKHHFCLHFARGMCAKGEDCTFFHRLPTPLDDANCDELTDIFGRSRHSTHKQDMSGVGAFTKPCRTLYVAGLLKHKYTSGHAMEERIRSHFSQWGEVESLNVIHRLSIAFPRFRLRTSAEFAKEAMQAQSLGEGEVLTVRWAFDDPNPVAADSISRSDKDALVALLQAKGISTNQASFNYPSHYALPASLPSDPSLSLSSPMSEYLSMNPHLSYPDTSAQYEYSSPEGHPSPYPYPYPHPYDPSLHTSSFPLPLPEVQPPPPSLPPSLSSDEDLSQLKSSFFGSLFQGGEGTEDKTLQDTEGKKKRDRSEEGEGEGQEVGEKRSHQGEGSQVEGQVDEEQGTEEEGGWEEHVDPASGATYYYNSQTGETSWSAPEP